METIPLYKEYRAYMSSALTLQDARLCDQVKHLNTLIEKWLREDLGVFLYLPQAYSDPTRADKMRPEEVYFLDRWRVAEADFLILNLDQPSFGVGQEAEIAFSMGKPMIPFHYRKNQVSRMIRGVPGMFPQHPGQDPSDAIIEYSDQFGFKDLHVEVCERVRMVMNRLNAAHYSRSTLPSFSERLRAALANSDLSSEDLARRCGVTTAFLEALQHDYESLRAMLTPYGTLDRRPLDKIPQVRFSNPGLSVLERIADVLDLSIGALIGEEDVQASWLEPVARAADKGLTLHEFLDVGPAVGYTIVYGQAARQDPTVDEVESVAEELLMNARQTDQR